MYILPWVQYHTYRTTCNIHPMGRYKNQSSVYGPWLYSIPPVGNREAPVENFTGNSSWLGKFKQRANRVQSQTLLHPWEKRERAQSDHLQILRKRASRRRYWVSSPFDFWKARCGQVPEPEERQGWSWARAVVDGPCSPPKSEAWDLKKVSVLTTTMMKKKKLCCFASLSRRRSSRWFCCRWRLKSRRWVHRVSFGVGFAVAEEATVFSLVLLSLETDDLPVSSIRMSFGEISIKFDGNIKQWKEIYK